jgi:hypothetical protein
MLALMDGAEPWANTTTREERESPGTNLESGTTPNEGMTLPKENAEGFLQKVRFWLYGVHFVLELDTNTLVAHLSKAATDLPGALVTRWLAWIQLFDFEVKHVDDWLAMELNAVGIAPIGQKNRTMEIVA